MSAYLQLSTPMTDTECLLDALADLGFERSMVEVHQQAVALVGYEGAAREQQAHIIIRRQRIGSASNDVGFVRTPTGLRLIVSGYDQSRFGSAWLARLSGRYEVHQIEKSRRMVEEQRLAAEEERRRLVEATRQAVIEKAKSSGYRIEEHIEQGRIRLVLSKRNY
jgi:hypothetical protein